jgi:hypothetical protein
MTPSRLGSDRLGAEPRAHGIIGRHRPAALVGVSRRQSRAKVRTWNGSRIVTGTLRKSLRRGAEQQRNEDGGESWLEVHVELSLSIELYSHYFRSLSRSKKRISVGASTDRISSGHKLVTVRFRQLDASTHPMHPSRNGAAGNIAAPF